MNAANRPAVRAFWSQRPQNLGEFTDMSKLFIERLRQLHPVLGGPMLLLSSKRSPSIVTEPLASDLSNFESFLSRYGWYNDFGHPTGLTADGSVMTREGTTRATFGFRLLPARDGRPANPEDTYLKVDGGSPDPVIPGVAWLEFPHVSDPTFEDHGFLRELLVAVVDCFDPKVGSIDNKIMYSAVMDLFPEIRDAVVPCWLNYFRDAGVRRDLPSWVQCEDFGAHGGVLITLQPDRPTSVDDPAWLRRVTQLHDALKPGNWYAHN